jgi:rubrerythrin
MAVRTTRTRPSVDERAHGPTVSAATASRAFRPFVALPNRRLATNGFGEAFLVYRCLDCGALGPLTAFPSACPDCEATRESLAYEVED